MCLEPELLDVEEAEQRMEKGMKNDGLTVDRTLLFGGVTALGDEAVRTDGDLLCDGVCA